MSQASFSLLKHYYLLAWIPRPHRTTRAAGVHAGRPYEEAPAFEAAAWAYMEDLVRRAKTCGSVG